MPTLFRVTIIGTIMGQTFNNVLNFQNTAAALNAQQVADEVQAEWVERCRIVQSVTVNYSQIRVQPLAQPLEAAYNKAINLPGNNTGSNNEYPFITMVLKIQTGTGGRHGRGRVCLPGLRIDRNENSLIRPDELLYLQQNCVNVLQTKFNGDNGTSPLTLGVMGKAYNSPWHPMKTIQIRAEIGTQRRRMLGVGI